MFFLFDCGLIADSVSLCCSFMLFVCGRVALVYSWHYFGGDVGFISLNRLILVFLIVMFLLVLTDGFILTLIMWEYLGFVRFLLILFYANSYRLRAALITVFASRFGDVALFCLVGGFLCGLLVPVAVLLLLFSLIVFTKRATYPFMSWLLEAMRAPTPVSSLVHSSTLVAAGV